MKRKIFMQHLADNFKVFEICRLNGRVEINDIRIVAELSIESLISSTYIFFCNTYCNVRIVRYLRSRDIGRVCNILRNYVITDYDERKTLTFGFHCCTASPIIALERKYYSRVNWAFFDILHSLIAGDCIRRSSALYKNSNQRQLPSRT